MSKEKALEKMLEEMQEKHSDAEDSIHNWLCDQNDEKLFDGILQESKSIKQAMFYCIEQAKKIKEGNVAMVVDDTVFEWVRDYFLGNETIINRTIQAEVKTKAVPVKNKISKKTKKKETIQEELQMSLF